MQHEFSHVVIREAYDLSQHRCQCTDPSCSHHSDDEGRCRQILRWPAQGEPVRDGSETPPVQAQSVTVRYCAVSVMRMPWRLAARPSRSFSGVGRLW